MQDRFTGDRNDFGKYSVLKALCAPVRNSGHPRLSLGVVWYLVPDDDPGDVLARCDPRLAAELKQCREAPNRRVKWVEEKGILPLDTIFYRELLTRQGRKEWMVGALHAMGPCDVVFLDPDTGVERPSLRYGSKDATKYVLWDEVQSFWSGGKSLVIYQQRKQRQQAEAHALEGIAQFSTRLEGCNSHFAVLFEESVMFFVAPKPRHARILAERAQDLAKRCEKLFRVVRPRGGQE